MRRIKRRAFTLIELMVVTAVIVVLLGVLMPVLAKARASSRAVKCGSNLRQIGIAVAAYTSEWNGQLPNNSYTLSDDPATLTPFPPTGSQGATTANDRGDFSTTNLEWFDVIAAINGWNGNRTVAARYGAGEQDIFRSQTQYLWCPDINRANQDPGVFATSYGLCRNVSKAYNIAGTPPLPSEGPYDILAYSAIPLPTDCVFLTEVCFWNYDSDAYDLTNASLANTIKSNFSTIPAKVNHAGLNYLFFDGHVSRLRIPPHSMGGELGNFKTDDNDAYSISAAQDSQFRQIFGALPGN